MIIKFMWRYVSTVFKYNNINSFYNKLLTVITFNFMTMMALLAMNCYARRSYVL